MDGFWDDLEQFGEDPFLDFPNTAEEMLGPYGWWEQQPQRPAYIWIPPAPQPTGTRGHPRRDLGGRQDGCVHDRFPALCALDDRGDVALAARRTMCEEVGR